MPNRVIFDSFTTVDKMIKYRLNQNGARHLKLVLKFQVLIFWHLLHQNNVQNANKDFKDQQLFSNLEERRVRGSDKNVSIIARTKIPCSYKITDKTTGSIFQTKGNVCT